MLAKNSLETLWPQWAKMKYSCMGELHNRIAMNTNYATCITMMFGLGLDLTLVSLGQSGLLQAYRSKSEGLEVLFPLNPRS